MRCLVCESFSFSHICISCRDALLLPDPQLRELESGLKVLSFFPYDEIDFLLKTKHSYLGHYVYKILADKSMRTFSQAFKYDSKLDLIPIDDKTDAGYAHTALLVKAMKSSRLKPSYATLLSQNSVSYSGKDLAFRKAHPRDFKLCKQPKHDVILVDDIVTSGTTLLEAEHFLKSNNITTMMAVTLADANR